MMPPTMLVPREELLYPTQTSPELRRMDMYNRARREEMESMLYSVSPRHTAAHVSNSRNQSDSLSISRIITGLRRAIGHALVTAGTRIQSPA